MDHGNRKGSTLVWNAGPHKLGMHICGPLLFGATSAACHVPSFWSSTINSHVCGRRPFIQRAHLTATDEHSNNNSQQSKQTINSRQKQQEGLQNGGGDWLSH